MIAFPLALALVTTSAINPTGMVTVDQWRKTTDENVKRIDDLYIASLIQGMMGINLEVAQRGGKPVFCAPEKLSFNGHLGVSVLASFADAHPEVGPFPLDVVMVKALEDTFPCKAGR